MAKSDDYALEEAIRSSEEIIREVEGFDLGSQPPAGVEDNITNHVRELEFGSLEAPEQVSPEGYVEVSVATDEMSAVADFYPPAEGRAPLTLSDVERALAAKQVTYGVDWQAVKEAVLACNTERIPVSEIAVARGKPPRDEVPAHLVIEPALLEKPPALDLQSLSVDYRAISPFRLVKKGEVLARLIPKQDGELGSTILGQALPFKKGTAAYPKPGENTEWSAEVVLAGCDGRFMLQADSFWVNQVLEVIGDIDYETGNIDFPGDVIIRGEVKQGFKVRSGGSLYCEEVIDVTEVRCQNDLVTKQGIIGRKTGMVKAGGGVTAKFIENCFVEAKGPVRIQTGCLNSMIHTLDRVETGPKGVIVGGKVYAQNGVAAGQIGTSAGPRTEVICGINIFVQQKLLWIRDKNISLATRLKQVESRLAADLKGNLKLVELQAKLRSAIHKLNKAAKALINELDKNERAAVSVTGTVFAGAYIEICHVPFIVTSKLAGVRFSLDKKKGRIIIDPLL